MRRERCKREFNGFRDELICGFKDMVEEMKTVKICAWCKKPMSFLAVLFRLFGLRKHISHGICWDCQESQLRRLNNLTAQQPNSPLRRRGSLKEVA